MTSMANYKKIAVYSWLVVTLVGGITVGSIFGLHGRELVFPVVLLLGGYALLLRWIMAKQYGAIPAESAVRLPASIVDPELSDNTSSVELNKNLSELVDGRRVMSSEEARQWLNQLLVKDQKK